MGKGARVLYETSMTDQSQIRIGVGVVVVRDDSVLLIKRGQEPRKGIWSIPGGHLELGETAAEGARRELAEETGLQVGQLHLADVVDSIKRENDSPVSQYVLIDYWAAYDGGQAVAGGDAQDCKWVGRDEIDTYVDWSETRRILQLALNAASHLNKGNERV